MSLRYGSGVPDPDPHQNVMDPQHWLKLYVSAHSPVWLLFHCSRSQCIAGYALSQVIHRNQSEIIIWKP
jgi:hypothetical protein